MKGCWALKTCWRMANNPMACEQFEGLVERVCGQCPDPQIACDLLGRCPDQTLQWTGEIRTYPEAFDAPLHARKPRVIFVWPHGDIAHADEETIGRIFATCDASAGSQFLILTKWPGLLLDKLRQRKCLLPDDEEHRFWIGSSHDVVMSLLGVGEAPNNIWLGVSATGQKTYDERVSALCDPQTGWPGNKWVSLEPLFEGIDLFTMFEAAMESDVPKWVIAGSADSLANGAAAFTPEIARTLHEQCETAGVPFWLKQRVVSVTCQQCWGQSDSICSRCGGFGLVQRVDHAPLLDGRQHLAAPEPIARILKEAGKLP